MMRASSTLLALALALACPASALAQDFVLGSSNPGLAYGEGLPMAWGDRNGDGVIDVAWGSYWGFMAGRQSTNGGTWSNWDHGGWGGQFSRNVSLVQINGFPGLETVWTANGNTLFTAVDGGPSAAVNTSTGCVGIYSMVADFNGDGFGDLWCQNSGVAAEVWLNQLTSPGQPTFVQHWISSTTYGVAGQPAFGDYDGDGDLDVMVGGYPTLHVFQNDGTGSFTLVWQSDPLYDNRHSLWADYDGDGDGDIVVVDVNGTVSRYRPFENVGNNTWVPQPEIDLGLGLASRLFAFDAGDWNRDGRDELVFSPINTGDTVIAGWDGTTWVQLWSANYVGKDTHDVDFIDVDGDGQLELIEANMGPGGVRIFGWDTDLDTVPDFLDACPLSPDTVDTDGDTIPDACDICPTGDDRVDTDGDTIPDACDICPIGDDTLDADLDTIPDACDQCIGDDLSGDTDGDGVCDNLDRCPTGDDALDADLDTVPDACDLCLGDDRLDADGDTVPDACDLCLGDDQSGDTDSDSVCDDRDRCLGDDSVGDTDGDGVCDDRDLCLGVDSTGDADSDGVCDDRDLCAGNDRTGDADGDGVCNDSDVCLGLDSEGDADSDGICDGADLCLGDDAAGDADADGICDDRDLCAGDDGAGDSDSDGVCDDRDLCAGKDSSGDSDTDGVCNDTDVCLGDDATGDSDADGICDDRDLCLGVDSTGDADRDGVCNDGDPIPLASDDGPYDVDEDAVLTVSAEAGVLANDQLADRVTLSRDATHGTVELAEDGSFVYTPHANFHGSDFFEYAAHDVDDWVTARVTLAVANPPDAPTAVGDGPYDAVGGRALSVGAARGLLANDSDLDGDALVVTLDAEPTLGTVELHEDGSFTYTAELDASGVDRFTYLCSDGSSSAIAQVLIAVVPGELTEVVDTDPQYYPPGAACHCSSTSRAGAVWPMLLGLLALGRRRRSA